MVSLSKVWVKDLIWFEITKPTSSRTVVWQVVAMNVRLMSNGRIYVFFTAFVKPFQIWNVAWRSWSTRRDFFIIQVKVGSPSYFWNWQNFCRIWNLFRTLHLFYYYRRRGQFSFFYSRHYLDSLNCAIIILTGSFTPPYGRVKKNIEMLLGSNLGLLRSKWLLDPEHRGLSGNKNITCFIKLLSICL